MAVISQLFRPPLLLSFSSLSGMSLVIDAAGTARAVLFECVKTLRSVPRELLDPSPKDEGHVPNLDRTVGNIQIQCTKLALARFSTSLNADAVSLSSSASGAAQSNERALAEALNQIGGLFALMLGEFIMTMKDKFRKAELRYAVDAVVQQRRARCINLCSAVERLIDEVIADEPSSAKSSSRHKDVVIQKLADLALEDSTKNEAENLQELVYEDANTQENEYKYVSAGILISQCSAFRRFEQKIAEGSDGVEGVLKVVADDVRLVRNMIMDVKAELHEFIEDPSSAIENGSDTWGLADSDSEDQDAEDSVEKRETDDKNAEQLLVLAKLWQSRINMITILYTSLLKRRTVSAVYDELLKKDLTSPTTATEAFAAFLNRLTSLSTQLSAELDEFGGGIMDGEDYDDVLFHRDSIKSLASDIAQLGYTIVEDAYSKWFAMWQDKFLEGI
ncbi:uncharacterized protein V1518DRAFT_372024 [Limtongia smithiae]|uniref:uncharacterized protein n=1 Tax=Limtongia smithiae TaxID=1125753 RepID=UPI0034CF3A01